MNRLLMIYATPRSGSTLLAAALEQQLASRGYRDLFEYFAHDFRGVEFRGGEIFVDKRKERWIDEQESLRSGAAKAGERARDRIERLLASKNSYIFKVFPFELQATDEDRLLRSAETIFLQRRDLFDQLLSYGISKITGRYYSQSPKLPEPRSLSMDFDVFVRFHRNIVLYREACARATHPIFVNFEDFLADPGRELRKIGVREPKPLDFSALPAKQNPGDKSDAFRNIDEIKSWYSDSFLFES